MYKSDAQYGSCRAGIYYFRRRVPIDFRQYYASPRLSFFKAFRSELDCKSYSYTFPDEMLSELLVTIKSNHLNIAHLICSGAGLRLMNIDSRICEYLIADFVQTDTPILTVHDSFMFDLGRMTGFIN